MVFGPDFGQNEVSGQEETGDDGLLTPEEAGRVLKVSRKHVIRLIENGQLFARNVGLGASKTRYRVPREAIDAFIKGTAIEESVTPAEGEHDSRRPRRAPDLTRLPDYFSE
jgi:excisionase family DNA binding protein